MTNLVMLHCRDVDVHCISEGSLLLADLQHWQGLQARCAVNLGTNNSMSKLLSTLKTAEGAVSGNSGPCIMLCTGQS